MYCYQFASNIHNQLKTQKVGDFPGGLLIDTLPSNAEAASLISTGELRSTYLGAKKPRHETEAIS